MPVRFSCSECGQRLNARDDKIGKTLKCPKCRTELVVPATDEALPDDPARDALKQLEQVIGDESYNADLIVYDDEESDDQSAARAEFDRELVSVSRNVVYLQAGLLAVAVLFGLTVGFLAGRGSAPSGTELPEQPEERAAIRVQGNLQISTGGGLRPDRGAVILALPADRPPEEKIPIDDLLPEAKMPLDGNLTLQQIATLGGDYTRADDDGNFALYLVPGKYQLTYVSYGAMRPSGNQVSRQDLAELGAYVTSGYEMIGQHRYRVEKLEIDEDTDLDYTFARE